MTFTHPRIVLPKALRCKRCGFRWVPRKTRITMCPECKTKYWNVPKEKKPR